MARGLALHYMRNRNPGAARLGRTGSAKTRGIRERRGEPELAGEMVEDFAGQGELIEAFLFGAKFRRVGNERATGAPRGMLDVQHLVIQDVLDDKLRDAGPVHAPIQHNLIGPGIIAAKLAAPATNTPADVGPAEFSTKIL